MSVSVWSGICVPAIDVDISPLFRLEDVMYRRWIAILVYNQSSHAVILLLYNVGIGEGREGWS